MLIIFRLNVFGVFTNLQQTRYNSLKWPKDSYQKRRWRHTSPQSSILWFKSLEGSFLTSPWLKMYFCLIWNGGGSLSCILLDCPFRWRFSLDVRWEYSDIFISLGLNKLGLFIWVRLIFRGLTLWSCANAKDCTANPIFPHRIKESGTGESKLDCSDAWVIWTRWMLCYQVRHCQLDRSFLYAHQTTFRSLWRQSAGVASSSNVWKPSMGPSSSSPTLINSD